MNEEMVETFGLLTEGVIADCTYTTSKGTEKTISGEVETIRPRHAGEYTAVFSIETDGEEKKRRLTHTGHGITVQARDRNTRDGWREIGRASLADVHFDLRLNGWSQRADETFTWRRRSDNSVLRVLSDVEDSHYLLVRDGEVVDVETMDSIAEAVQTAEHLMQYKY